MPRKPTTKQPMSNKVDPYITIPGISEPRTEPVKKFQVPSPSQLAAPGQSDQKIVYYINGVEPVYDRPSWGSKYKTKYSEYVRVTPDVAKKILESNTQNRPLDMGHVKDYVTEMKTGNWSLATSGISLNRDGVLEDGQHRLHAVVILDEPVVLELVWNAPVGKGRYDQGKSRRSSQQCSMEKSRFTSSQWSRIHAVYRPWRAYVTGIHNPISASELSSFEDKYRRSIKWILSLENQQKIPGCVASVMVHVHSKYHDPMNDLATGYVSGEGLKRGDPALALSKKVPLSGTRSMVASEEQFYYACHAAVLSLTGERKVNIEAERAYLEKLLAFMG